MTVLGFFVVIISWGIALAIKHSSEDTTYIKRKEFERRWDEKQRRGEFTNYNRDGSLKHEDYPCQNLSEHMRNKYDEMKRDGRL